MPCRAGVRVPLDQLILPSEVQAWVKGMSTSMAPSSVEACYRLLATILKSAVADRLIPSGPCIRIRLPKKHTDVIEPLTVEQVAAVHDQMPERARAIVTLAAGTGLRRGEALGLTLDRVDFLRRTITVDRQLMKKTTASSPRERPKKEALRALKRRVSDAVWRQLQVDLGRR